MYIIKKNKWSDISYTSDTGLSILESVALIGSQKSQSSLIRFVMTSSPIVGTVPKQLDLGSAYRLAPQSPVSRSSRMTF